MLADTLAEITRTEVLQVLPSDDSAFYGFLVYSGYPGWRPSSYYFGEPADRVRGHVLRYIRTRYAR